MLGECVVFPYDHGKRIVDQGLNGQRSFVDGSAQKADIEAVFHQLGNLLGGAQFGELELDVGVVPAVRAHHIRQDTVDRGLQGTDVEVPQLPGGGPARGRERSFAVREREPGLFEKCVAGIGELDRPPGPIDQVHSQLAFQLLNLLTKRRLRNMEPFGGTAEVSFLRHGHEVAQQPQLRVAHILKI